MGRRKTVERDPLSLDAARARALGFGSYGRFMPHKEALARQGRLPAPEELPDPTPPRCGAGPVIIIRNGQTQEGADSTAGWKCNRRLNWDREAGYRMWAEGKTDAQIAEALGICTATVRRHRQGAWAIRAKRESRDKTVSRHIATGGWDTDAGYRMWLEGVSLKKIAKALGTYPAAVAEERRSKWERRAKEEGAVRRLPQQERGKVWDTERGYRLWLEGRPQREIAAELGICITTVSVEKRCRWEQRAKAEGVRRRKRPGADPKWDTERGYKLWLQGWSAERIAEELGVSRSSVSMRAAEVWKERAIGEGHTEAARLHTRSKPKWDTEEGYRKYLAGVSIARIAREAGMSQPAVQHYCDRHWRSKPKTAGKAGEETRRK